MSHALVLAALLLSAPPQGGDDAGLGLLARGAADADGSGELSRAEWDAFVAGLGAGPDGRLDRELLVARLIEPLCDADGDGRVTRADVEALLEPPPAPSADDGATRASRGLSGLARALVVGAADASGDGALSEGERADFVATLPPDADGALELAVLQRWIARTRAEVPRDASATAPPLLLLAIEGGLDADGDGAHETEDLVALFERLDADGNGALDAGELAPRRASGAGSRARGGADGIEPLAGAPLVSWQRDLEDALALVAATGKPLLICVNMDGEPASEVFARSRYRDPAFAELARGFVPLIVSPDRHTARDHDDRGRRRACARFGRVLCAEHDAIEPELFARYFDGRRVAPRHVGVSPAGEVLFDLYLLNDLSRVDAALERHGVPGAPAEPEPEDEAALLASPDAAHRERLEAGFVAAAEDDRARLAGRALEGGARHPELVRLALRDPSPAVRRAAAAAVAEVGQGAPLELFARALRESAGAPELRAKLVDVLDARGEDEPDGRRAGRLARTFRALATPSAAVDRELWLAALEGAETPPEPPATDELVEGLTAELDQLDRALRQRRDDPELWLDVARTTLELGEASLELGRDPTFFLQDARRAAEEAGPSGAAGAVRARASWLLGEPDAAADAARAALPALLAEDPAGRAAARALDALLRGRTRQVYAALEPAEPVEVVDPEWLADAVAAGEVLAAHPRGDESQALLWAELLGVVEARAEELAALERGLARFPTSGDLHAALRAVLLRDEGADALEAWYAAREPAEDDAAALRWYEGLATLVAAEWRVQSGAPGEARAAYERSVADLRASVELEPGFAGSAHHYEALALAGRARLDLEAGDLEAARAAMAEALAVAPASADVDDGLGVSPRESARTVRRALEAAGRREEAAALEPPPQPGPGE